MKDELSPEEVLIRFFIANLSGNEKEIRPLIVDNADAALLWKGPYPPQVAELLARQYRTMSVSRVEESLERVFLQSTAAPFSIAVVKVGSTWKVDASRIIAIRKAAKK